MKYFLQEATLDNELSIQLVVEDPDSRILSEIALLKQGRIVFKNLLKTSESEEDFEITSGGLLSLYEVLVLFEQVLYTTLTVKSYLQGCQKTWNPGKTWKLTI